MNGIMLVFVLISVNLFASDTYLLKKNKQEIIKQQQIEIESNTDKLKYDWVSTLTISASYSKSDIYSKYISDASVRLNQDIFRSGGILYRLKYADIKLKHDLTSLALQNRLFLLCRSMHRGHDCFF